MILEVLSKIGFDYKLALANMVNFLIIFWLLKRFLWAPLSRAIEERKKMVQEGVLSSKSADEKLVKAEAESKNIIVEAHKKAKELTDRAESKGDEILEHFKIEAMKEKERIIKDGMDDVARRERDARARIQDEMADMVVAGAEKLIGEEINSETKASFASKMSSSS